MTGKPVWSFLIFRWQVQICCFEVNCIFGQYTTICNHCTVCNHSTIDSCCITSFHALWIPLLKKNTILTIPVMPKMYLRGSQGSILICRVFSHKIYWLKSLEVTDHIFCLQNFAKTDKPRTLINYSHFFGYAVHKRRRGFDIEETKNGTFKNGYFLENIWIRIICDFILWVSESYFLYYVYPAEGWLRLLNVKRHGWWKIRN